ncbi:MAG TPA: NADH-quinone oxidoreductase subunit N [Anaeromyxobacteraceae bacterium]|nr:NADH-quinone oxidoreductase subunit N [Anaeromyxobacteraceae bacterium]
MSTLDLQALLPVILLGAGALTLMLSEVYLTSGRRAYQSGLAFLVAVAAGLAAAVAPERTLPGGQAVSDGFSSFVICVVCAGLALSVLLGRGWLERRGIERGEYYALALFGTSGMALLGMATDLLLAFIAIEVMSLAVYALAAYPRRGQRPSEAAFKYFIIGSFASALFLYGSALVYGATGTTLFSGIGRGGGALLATGLALVLAGLAFKVAAVPFHAWTPDVYEGAPTPVTAFMAAGVKAAAFALLARGFLAMVAGTSVGTGAQLGGVLGLLAVLSMVVGNLFALPQRNVKRMLAYSSIAHAGYLLVGVLAAGSQPSRQSGISAVLFYLAAYAVTVIGAFAVVTALERVTPSPDVEAANPWDLSRFAGLAKSRPGLAFAMAIFMFSLAGVPPTAGFVAKFAVFQAAVSARAYGLAVVGVLTSVLGAYYYLRVVVAMYMGPARDGEEAEHAPVPMAVAIALAALAVVALGVGPESIATLARAAATRL